MTGLRGQRGVSSVLALLVASGAILTLLSWYTGFAAAEAARYRAVEAGREFSQVMSAVRSWIPFAANKLPALVAGFDPGLPLDWTPLGGLGFLRDPTCSPDGDNFFLPCHVADHGGNETIYGTDYSVQVRYQPDAGPVGAPYVQVRVFFVLPEVIERRPLLAAFIAGSAAQTIMGPEDPASGRPTIGSYISFWPNASEAVPNGEPDPLHFGKVAALASNDPTEDAWLRVDGTNQMLNNLNNGGFSLINAKHVEAAGNGLFGNGVVAGSDIAALNGNVIAGNHGAGGAGLDDGVGEGFFDNLQIGDMTLENGAHPRMSQGIYDARMVVNGSIVRKPTCPPSSSPQIFAVPATYSSGQTAQAIHAVDARIVDNGSSWTVNVDILTSPAGWVPSLNDSGGVDNSYRRAVVITKCA